MINHEVYEYSLGRLYFYAAFQNLKKCFLWMYMTFLKCTHLTFSNINIESSLYICCDYEQMELRQWKGMKEEKDG